jgi:hypothetical protein
VTEPTGTNAVADDWETRNNAFLQAALTWLRLRVRRAVPAPPEAVVTVRPTPLPDRGGDGSRWRRRSELPAATPLAIGRATSYPSEDDIEEARRAMDAAAAGEPPPALIVLVQRLGLSAFERNVLLLATAPEYDTGFGKLYADVQGDPARRQPTFALAMAVFDDKRHWEALAPHRPLRNLDLVVTGGAESLMAAPLRAPERIVHFVKGMSYLDSQLTALLAPLDDQPRSPAPSQARAVEQIVAAAGMGGVVNLVGADRPSKQLVAGAAADRVGARLVRLPAAHLPTTVEEQAALGRLLERERLLSPMVLYLDTDDADPAGPEGEPGRVDRFVTAYAGLVLFDSREPWPRLPNRARVVDVARPTTAEQRAEWLRRTGDPAVAAATAAEFDLDVGFIDAIADVTADVAADDRAAAVRQACRSRLRPRLGQLAQRLSPRPDDGSLVLTPEVSAQLDLIEQQVLLRATVLDDWGMAQQGSRGLGLTALFAGEPGVGKTCAAELLAGRLDMDLFRVDLSGVQSKYIGETEKNLRIVFDAVDRGGTILFFDEADALFGKRTEVRDSHDRYANIEVSYLLSRMEMHRGLAILATNMKGGMDEAFARRLRISVDFPFPSAKDRALIWASAFPPGATLDGLDFDWLARLTLAGGAIRNIAVNATFLAAAAQPQKVTMAMVLDAARAEYRKLGLPASVGDFAWAPPVPLGSGAP